MAMTTRRGKGAKLTWDEGDDNFERVALQKTDKIGMHSEPFFADVIGKVTLTNNSNEIGGNGFVSINSYKSIQNLNYFFVLANDSAYKVQIDTIISETTASISDVFNLSDVKEENSLGSMWLFDSGEYVCFASVSILNDGENIFLGKNIFSSQEVNDIVAIGNRLNLKKGSGCVYLGQILSGETSRLILIGNNILQKLTAPNSADAGIMIGSNLVVDGGNNYPTGAFSIIIAYNSSITSPSGQRNAIIGGDGNNMVQSGSHNAMINCNFSQLGIGTINQVTAIGFKDVQLDFSVLTNCVIVPRLMIHEIPVFESDALAADGGLIGGMAYRNAAGQAFYKLP